MSGKTEKKKKNGVLAVVVLLVLIIAALVVVIVRMASQHQDNNATVDPVPKRNVVINQENVDELIDDLEEDAKVLPGNYEVVMNPVWYFKDGKSESTNAYVENALSNTNDVFFDVKLAETNEVIFSSPLLPIGSHIENIQFDKELKAGNYDCVVVYSLVDEEQNVLSQVSVSLTVSVES